MEEIRKINVYVSLVAKDRLVQFQRSKKIARQDDALDTMILDWDRMNEKRLME